jgi:hypothetical protein
LPEYARYSGLKAEIQIRTILQHAWAEIEHDLGYKTTLAVPRAARRQFSMLAGLLELADLEFERLATQLEAYAESLPPVSDPSYEPVPIDKHSLSKFVADDPLVAQVDEELASAIGKSLSFDQAMVDSLVDKLAHVGFRTIADVSRALETAKMALPAFAEPTLQHSRKRFTYLNRGTSLFYLCSYRAAERNADDSLLAYLNAFQLGQVGRRESLAQSILENYMRAQSVARDA